jgi:hypothetical protein
MANKKMENYILQTPHRQRKVQQHEPSKNRGWIHVLPKRKEVLFH